MEERRIQAVVPERVAVVMALAPVAAIAALVVALQTGVPDWPKAVRAAVLLGAIAVCALGVLRARVDVTADGLTVRSTWRTRRIAWADVDRFEPRTGPPGADVVLRSGERVRLDAVQAPWRQLDGLNADLAAARRYAGAGA